MSGAGARAERSADIELRGLHKRYGAVVAVESLDLRAEPGEFVSLLGPSGCGKTTTLRAIAGLTQPDGGLVIIGGRVMNDVPVHRRGLGLVPQNYALFPHMTVMENVTFGLRMRRTAPAGVERKAREALPRPQPQPGRRHGSRRPRPRPVTRPDPAGSGSAISSEYPWSGYSRREKRGPPAKCVPHPPRSRHGLPAPSVLPCKGAQHPPRYPVQGNYK